MGVHVELLREDRRVAQETRTDTLGLFLLQPKRSGVYRLRLTHPFYRDFVSDTISVDTDEVVRIELQLGRSVVPLEPLVVVARSRDPFDGFYERAERSGAGNYITRAEIDRRRDPSVTLMLAHMPGIRLRDVSRGPGLGSDRMVRMRGGTGECAPTIFMDGMRLGQIDEGSLDDFLRPDILEGVEIYPSRAGMPVQFENFGDCGVIAFWTRPVQGSPFTWKRLLGAAAAAGVFFLLTR